MQLLLSLLCFFLLAVPHSSAPPSLSTLFGPNLPPVLLSYCTTAHGAIPLSPNKTSCPDSLIVTQVFLRRAYDYIIIGRNTLDHDDPVLAPHPLSPNQPADEANTLTPVIVTESLKICKPYDDLRLARRHDGAVFITTPAAYTKQRLLLKLFSTPPNFYSSPSWTSSLIYSTPLLSIYNETLAELHRLIITTPTLAPPSLLHCLRSLHALTSPPPPLILVEGGPKTLANFLAANVHNATLITLSNKATAHAAVLPRATKDGDCEGGSGAFFPCGEDVLFVSGRAN